MGNLKILIGGGLREIVHKKSFGGGGIFVYFLASELAKRGNDVSILCLSESFVPNCKIIPITTEEQVTKTEMNYPLHDTFQLIESQYIASNYNKYDIVHINYFHYLFAPFSKFLSKPVIFTEHLPLLTSPIWQKLINTMVKPTDLFIFVAKHAYNKAALIKNKACIAHGIDTSFFPFSDKNENYMFWLGRAKPKKGLLEAVLVAKKTNYQLLASLVINRQDDKLFFEKQITPLITNQKNIHLLNPLPYPEKVSYYQKAKLFLFPIQWEEPFGLVMIEAMACGTPVVAYARGSVPEVIKDGETGFIVNESEEDKGGDWIVKKSGLDGLCEAVERIYTMPEDQYRQMRKNCRAHVEKHFTVERMVNEYEKVYKQILNVKS